jgi:signal transduction histidine kinase
VSVSIECVEDAETHAKLRFEVSDTGIGIESEDMERVFHNFEQADGSMTRQYGGVGLGLPISRGLVNLMGGTLRVARSPEQGSRFWFEISLDKAVSFREINR